MKFRLKPNTGSHAGPGEGGKFKTYKPGDTVESEQDLCKVFPNKFERIPDEAPSSFSPSTEEQKAAVSKAAKKGAKGVAPPETEEPEPNPLGRDVTKRFPTAQEEDFQVFADGGAFSVVEADDPTEALNDKPLKRKDVEPFIRQYLET